MHSCLCAIFHAWRCICTVCLHICLNSIYGFKQKERPWGLLRPPLIGMLIMSLWVGYHSVCVCVYVCGRSMTILQRHCMTAGVLSSSLSCSDTAMARGRSFSQLRRDRQPRPITWGWVQIKHFSMCVVMRSCVFVHKLSVSGLLPLVCWLGFLLPLVCWLGWAFLLCWCLDVFFSCYPPPPARSTLEGNKEKRRNPTPSLPWGPLLVMAKWLHRGGCRVMRAGKISYVKTREDRNVREKRE